MRRAGGGRTPTEKKRSEVIARIEADDPRDGRRSGLKWTHRTTVKLAHELRGLGIHVCPQTVARLLKAMGLRVNHKSSPAPRIEPRPAVPVHHPRALRRRQHPGHQATKKKELVGAFRSRREVGPQPRTAATTTTSRSMPRASPSPTASTTRAPMPAPSSSAEPPTPRRSHVDCIEKWWRTEGRNHYPQGRACSLADGGEATFHGARLEVQPATSPLQPRHRGPLPARHAKWKPIEHRLFCEIGTSTAYEY